MRLEQEVEYNNFAALFIKEDHFLSDNFHGDVKMSYRVSIKNPTATVTTQNKNAKHCKGSVNKATAPIAMIRGISCACPNILMSLNVKLNAA